VETLGPWVPKSSGFTRAYPSFCESRVKTLEKRLLDFQAYYETLAKPFQWKFTRTDLERTLAKLSPYMPEPTKAAA